jgi:hypothetical protein
MAFSCIAKGMVTRVRGLAFVYADLDEPPSKHLDT